MPFNAHGWTILFYTDFRMQWEDLTDRAIKLKSRLALEDFVRHPDVKLPAIPNSTLKWLVEMLTAAD